MAWMTQGSNPGRGKPFFFISSTPALGPGGYLGSFLGVNEPRHNVDHSPLSSADVWNEWSYTSTPSICLHVMDRDNFYPFLTLMYLTVKQRILHMIWLHALKYIIMYSYHIMYHAQSIKI
jgi:hypothetical protein